MLILSMQAGIEDRSPAGIERFIDQSKPHLIRLCRAALPHSLDPIKSQYQMLVSAGDIASLFRFLL